MSIRYNEAAGTITLNTRNTSYQMKIGRASYLLHLYYGPALSDADMSYQIKQYDRGFSGNPYDTHQDRTFSLDAQPQEFPAQQQGDFRIPAIEVVNTDGSYSFNGRVKSFNISKCKYRLDTLPTSFARRGDKVDTLEVVLEDAVTKVQAVLLYSVYEDFDIITRAVKVVNAGSGSIRLKRIMSLCLDFLNGSGFDLINLPGRYGQERQVERQPLTHHIHTVSSGRGSSSHQQNPFMVLCDRTAGEDHGSCYGAALVYSGNFIAEAELDQYDQARLLMGIGGKQFDYLVNAGEEFEAPEVLLGFSARGLTGLSHLYHDFFRERMCESRFVHRRRPIPINTWEAAFFDFDDEKLLEIARSAKQMGVELLVMDDGWFGKRTDDNAGLGDWVVNTEKIRCGLDNLVKQVNDIGLKFGIWFEPEMVSEDSDLFRAHPDWVMAIPGRRAVRSRNQLVLDITRKDVQDYVISAVNRVIDSADIAYVKWDINRSVTDVFSNALPAERQGEVYHRYVLGLYRIMDGIIKTHPGILFEGCSGGGGRYDPAMLTYFPQYWMSDNTRPLDNLKLHYGTSLLYPVCTMGAHVSDADPKVPLSTRAAVAMCGTFGYELDATRLGKEELAECRKQSRLFKKYFPVIFYGDYFRLTDPFRMGNFTAWQSVSKDGSESLLTVVITGQTVNGPQEYVRAKGLEPGSMYRIERLDITLSGSALMNAGLPVPREVADYSSFQYYLKRI